MSLSLAVAALNDQENKLTLTQITYRGPGKVLKGSKASRKALFNSLVHSGFWISASKTHRLTDSYVPILQIGQDVDSLAPQSKGDESRSHKDTWDQSAVNKYVKNSSRRHNFTVNEQNLKKMC